jgi:ABC-type polysaccharide/polyol phosphate export permease
MKFFLAPRSMRFFFFVSSMVLWLGIHLSGFSNVHWLLYFPAVFFLFAAVTGICPGMILSRMLFKEAGSSNSNT